MNCELNIAYIFEIVTQESFICNWIENEFKIEREDIVIVCSNLFYFFLLLLDVFAQGKCENNYIQVCEVAVAFTSTSSGDDERTRVTDLE